MPSRKPPPQLSSETFAALFDAQAAPTVVMDAGWRILFSNRAALEFLGYEQAELAGRHVDDIVPEQLRERYRRLREAREQGGPNVVVRGERLVRTKDGREVPVMFSVARAEVTGTDFRVATLLDLSQQKEAEQETIERLYSIVEHSDVGVFLVQVGDDGAFIFESFNPVTERLTGLKREQARGRGPEQVVPAAEAARVLANYRHAVTLAAPYTYEEIGTTAEGTRTFRTTLVPIRNRSGRVHRLIGLSHDITGQRLAEDALAAARQSLSESEEKFKKAFAASPHPICITDLTSNKLLEVNDAFERVFGHARAAALGKTTIELGIWRDPSQRLRMLELAREQGAFRDLEVVGLDTQGRELALILSGEQIESGGKRWLVTYVNDVTERVRVERAKSELETQLRQAQKMDALGTLAGGIAHDFNNILGAMLAYSELIKLDIHLPVQIEAYLVELRRAGDRARDLVQQILTFSRRQPQQRRPLRLEAAVRDTLNLLRSTLPATIRIDVRSGEGVPLVLADPTQIHQILTNLGTNAAHALKLRPGKLGIELDGVTLDAGAARISSELQPGRYARLSVRDDGEGMRPETLKHVFEPFFTTKAPGEGTGLGLAVVHGIVRDHEGAIVIESEPERGTLVTIYFPEHAVELEANAEPRAELVRANGESVLFIDDEVVLCRSVSGLLERLGYQVTARSDPAEALELFRKTPKAFDIVLTDLTMPGLTGVDIAREVLKLAPRKPVLMMSGFNSTWTAEALKTLGVLDLIPKPLGAARLSASLAAALGKRAPSGDQPHGPRISRT